MVQVPLRDYIDENGNPTAKFASLSDADKQVVTKAGLSDQIGSGKGDTGAWSDLKSIFTGKGYASDEQARKYLDSQLGSDKVQNTFLTNPKAYKTSIDQAKKDLSSDLEGGRVGAYKKSFNDHPILTSAGTAAAAIGAIAAAPELAGLFGLGEAGLAAAGARGLATAGAKGGIKNLVSRGLQKTGTDQFKAAKGLDSKKLETLAKGLGKDGVEDLGPRFKNLQNLAKSSDPEDIGFTQKALQQLGNNPNFRSKLLEAERAGLIDAKTAQALAGKTATDQARVLIAKYGKDILKLLGIGTAGSVAHTVINSDSEIKISREKYMRMKEGK